MCSDHKYFLADDRRQTTANRYRYLPPVVWLLSSGSGFPHSEMSGSKPVRGSPDLIAAYHVLHRLSAPRHPPNTLITLDRFHYRCPTPRQEVHDTAGPWQTRPRRSPANPPKETGIAAAPIFIQKTISSSNTPDAPSSGRRSASQPSSPQSKPGQSRTRHETTKATTASDAFPLYHVQHPAPHQSRRTNDERNSKINECVSRAGTLCPRTSPPLDATRRRKADRPPAPCQGDGRRRPAPEDPRRDRKSDAVVEPDGIEPTTSCLQSRRSPS